MNRFLVLAFVCAAFIPQTSFAANYSAQQCQSWFRSVDRNQDGSLAKNENAAKFLNRITLANDDDQDFVMSRAFFVAECKIGSLGKPQI